MAALVRVTMRGFASFACVALGLIFSGNAYAKDAFVDWVAAAGLQHGFVAGITSNCEIFLVNSQSKLLEAIKDSNTTNPKPPECFAAFKRVYIYEKGTTGKSEFTMVALINRYLVRFKVDLAEFSKQRDLYKKWNFAEEYNRAGSQKKKFPDQSFEFFVHNTKGKQDTYLVHFPTVVRMVNQSQGDALNIDADLTKNSDHEFKYYNFHTTHNLKADFLGNLYGMKQHITGLLMVTPDNLGAGVEANRFENATVHDVLRIVNFAPFTKSVFLVTSQQDGTYHYGIAMRDADIHDFTVKYNLGQCEECQSDIDFALYGCEVADCKSRFS